MPEKGKIRDPRARLVFHTRFRFVRHSAVFPCLVLVPYRFVRKKSELVMMTRHFSDNAVEIVRPRQKQSLHCLQAVNNVVQNTHQL